ncbi:MAG: Vps62-related protein [Acidobacteriota bacterium]
MHFEKIFGSAQGAIYRPIPEDGFHLIGFTGQATNIYPSAPVITLREDNEDKERPLLRPPIRFASTGTPIGAGQPLVQTWLPIAPPGYVPLGMAAAPFDEGEPPVETLRCLRLDQATPVRLFAGWISDFGDFIHWIEGTNTLWYINFRVPLFDEDHMPSLEPVYAPKALANGSTESAA